jgi:hypothetical protein
MFIPCVARLRIKKNKTVHWVISIYLLICGSYGVSHLFRFHLLLVRFTVSFHPLYILDVPGFNY